MAQAMGIPVPWVYTGVFAIGAAMAAASGVLFGPLVGVNHTMGLDWVLKAFIVVVVGGMGNLGGSIAAAIFISLLEAYASIWVSPAQAVIVSFVVLILTLLFRPTGLFVPDAQMSPSRQNLLDRLCRGHGAADRRAAGAAGILAALPHRDPDLGPAGDVVRSADRLHRHGLVRPFGLLRARHVRRGGRAAAGQPAQSVARDRLGLAGAAGAALFVAYFSTRLRDIYFAITTLIFSQIFYVIIFTWTAVTGGENGLIFSRPHFAIPFLVDCASRPRPCTGSCWRWWRRPI